MTDNSCMVGKSDILGGIGSSISIGSLGSSCTIINDEGAFDIDSNSAWCGNSLVDGISALYKGNMRMDRTSQSFMARHDLLALRIDYPSYLRVRAVARKV